ncbi:MAG: glycosyltransferase family 25 protein [Paracoccaceae bacterium]|jgi:glycosyl transferase family 25
MNIPVYVISLQTALERRQGVRAEMARHGLWFEFVDAIDGASMTAAERNKAYDAYENSSAFKRPLSTGEIACALSHRAIWWRIASSKAPFAMVCEDDMRFLSSPKPFLALAEQVGDHLEDVIIKLDGVVPRGKEIGQLGAWALLSARRLPPRTTGYLIGRKAARRLLDQFPATVRRPVDIDLKRYWEHRVPVLVAHPQLVAEQAGVVSSLSASRAERKAASLVWRFWRNLSYQGSMVFHRALHTPERHRTKALSNRLRELEIRA